MKAITIQQPYAHLIAIGEKRVENRTWPTNHRGLIAIHAGKGKDYLDRVSELRFPDMPFGAVEAVALLVGCVRFENVGRYAKETGRFWLVEHEHVEGPWCWVLEVVKLVSPPIPYKGSQGLWTLPDKELEAGKQNTGQGEG